MRQTLLIHLRVSLHLGMKLTIHGIHGFLKTKVVSFVMNLHTVPRPVYLVRHGESVFNVRGLVGGGKILFWIFFNI